MNPLWLVHSGTVETFAGAGPNGDTYNAPATVRGYLDDGLVRVQRNGGEELVQKSTWYGPIEDAALFAAESRVVLNGRPSQVSAVRRREAGGLFVPVAHIEVDLT